MYTFTPPTRLMSMSDSFWGRYSIPVGETVIRSGDTFITQPYPWLGDLDGLVDGEDYFLGGHVYTITDEIAAELASAGYEIGPVVVDPDPEPDPGDDEDPPGYGEGPYGSGPYGS